VINGLRPLIKEAALHTTGVVTSTSVAWATYKATSAIFGFFKKPEDMPCPQTMLNSSEKEGTKLAPTPSF